MAFSDLGLSAKVLDAVATAGYSEPTPIQAQAIPPALQGRDVLGIAQTGTGKTASFVLPLLTKLEKGRARARMPRSLILEPTRELAMQVANNFTTYGANQKLKMALLIGGVSPVEQEKILDRGADVLIATPGRLMDHFGRGRLMMTGVEYFVIDEADRMLDMGFIPDIEAICKMLPFTRQTLLFSATMPPEIQRLTESFLQNPLRIEVAPPATTVATTSQRIVPCAKDDKSKRQLLRDLISAPGVRNGIIFCNRKRTVEILNRSLERHGFNSGALHGDMAQSARFETLEKFRAGNLQFLVASDVAARGLDIPNVSHIFNYEIPSHADDYVHRIGRTGRAGRKGCAISLVPQADMKLLAAIEALIGHKIATLEDSAAAGAAVDQDAKDKKAPAKPRLDPEKPKFAPAKADKKAVSKNDADTPTENAAHEDEKNKPRKKTAVVIGMGSHVPAFMLQACRPAAKPAAKVKRAS